MSVRNLTTIDESGSMLYPSDISFDKTEDDDLDGAPRVPRSAKRPSVPTPGDDDDDDDDDVRPAGKRSRHAPV